MKRATNILAVVASILLATHSAFADTNRSVTSFDPDWKFLLDDPKGAEAVDFDDSTWRSLNVPHDWSIEGTFDPKNPSGTSGGFLPDGVGWYRKHFSLSDSDANRRVYIEFEGVMENSDVWINGFHLGHRPYGYITFIYDLTGHLNFGGKENILAVRVDDSLQPDSRWYTGAGIYRHVKLIETEPIHLANFSTYITTPTVSADSATVHVETTAVNDSNAPRTVVLVVPYSKPDGTAVGPRLDLMKPTTLASGQSAVLSEDFPIDHPALWGVDSPNLYQMSVQLRDSTGQMIDSETVPVGIRQFEFKADTGFWLNGRNMKILGAALHTDAGALGAAVPTSVWVERLTQLKGLGVNAIRCAHNPPSPEFLDACDRLGLLVMDEMFDCWTVGKTSLRDVPLQDYHLYFNDWWKQDVTDTLLRDRNHPSIILWSAGNEIRDINPNNDLGARVFTGIRDVMHQVDPTRPVTMAVLRPNQNNVYSNGFSELMDVVGQNYRETELLAAHAAKPTRKILGTENHHELVTWQLLRDNPAYSGQFIWTGFDYLGESRSYSAISHLTGFFDRTGELRGQGYQRASWWSSNPMVQIARVAPAPPVPPDPADPNQPRGPRTVQDCDWTPTDLSPHQENLEIYSNCQDVELVLNDKSLGSKPRPADDSPRKWTVDFEPGKIVAIGRNDGKEVARCEMNTAGKPAKIALQADRSSLPNDWDDVTYIRATVVDDAGTLVPSADNKIQFAVDGAGELVGVDNGDLQSHEPFRGNQRSAFEGKCVAIIRSNANDGKITVSASADGLAGSAITLTAAPPG